MRSVNAILTLPVGAFTIADIIGKLNRIIHWYQFIAIWISICNTSVNTLMYLMLFQNGRSKTVAIFTTLYYREKCW